MGAPLLRPGPARIEEVTERAQFLALAPEWNALVRDCDDQAFYRHEFIRVWLESFAPRARLRILTLREGSGRLGAVLPLIEQPVSVFGRSVRQLVSPANAHTPRCDLLARDPQLAGPLLVEHLAHSNDWDLLRLSNVPDGGAAWAVHRAAAAAGLAVGTIQGSQSPYRLLPPSGEQLDAQLKPRLRSQMRRALRLLSERGPVVFERVCAGAAVERWMDEAFALEERGWKGQAGTAMAQDAATRRFYLELARSASRSGVFALHLLRVGSTLVAFDYVLEHAGRYAALKGSFDERFAAGSPGHLLTYLSMRDGAERGLREFDLLGQVSEAKLRWTNRVRGHSWLVVFRSSLLGFVLCPPGYGWLPVAQAVILNWARHTPEP
jgi:CelD/BcsL family acetyltransferase involved in cellulose biosynthesis